MLCVSVMVDFFPVCFGSCVHTLQYRGALEAVAIEEQPVRGTNKSCGQHGTLSTLLGTKQGTTVTGFIQHWSRIQKWVDLHAWIWYTVSRGQFLSRQYFLTHLLGESLESNVHSSLECTPAACQQTLYVHKMNMSFNF